MSKLPYMSLNPEAWLRETAGLSPLAKGVWITIMAYAWDEPQRGVYERSREAFCRELRVDPKDLISLLSELTQVASIRASDAKVTLELRQMLKIEKSRKFHVIRQARYRMRRRRDARVTLDVTPKAFEVKEKEIEKEKRKDVAEKKKEKDQEKEKNDLPASQAPDAPRGLPPGPQSKPEVALKPNPETAHLAEPLDPLTRRQLEAQRDYIERVRAKVRRDIEREREAWEDL